MQAYRESRKLPSEEEEGRLARSSIWGVAAGDSFLRLVTLVIGNLRFLPEATSVRDGAPWPIFGLSAGKA